VAEQHDARLEALRPSRGDVLLPQDLQEAGADLPHQRAGQPESEGDSRQGHQQQVAARRVREPLEAGRRQQVKRDGQPEDQQDRQEERGHGDPAERHHAPEGVPEAVGADGCDDPGRNRNRQREQHREGRKLQRDRQSDLEAIDDRLAVPGRSPEVALHHPTQPVYILQVDWTIQAQIPPERLVQLR